MMDNWIHGRLVRRYKRFLVDVRLDSGEVITAHCPNTGSMRNCLDENAEVWLSRADNPRRKYALTWECLRSHRGHMIGINTGRANALTAAAIENGTVTGLGDYSRLRREVRWGDSRIDLMLERASGTTYIEVKSVTLLDTPVSRGQGYFPDAVSERARKHLRTLQEIKQAGHRAVLFFCVQHTGIRRVSPAWQIDPAYSEALLEAADAGVEVLAYRARFTRQGPVLVRSLPVDLSRP